MPPAKRSTSRSTRSKPQSANLTATSRAQLEKAIKRLEKSLDDARDALTSLGKDVGHGGHRTYKDLGGALRGFRNDAQKANRTLTKELERLRAAATPGRSSSSSRRSSTARKASGTARKATGGARKATSSARKSASSRAGGRRTSSGRGSGRGRS